MKKILSAIAIVAMTTSCINTQKRIDISQLNGKWDIVSVTSISEIQNEQKPYIEINTNELTFSGFATCNRIFGSLVTDSVVSDKVSFSVAMTRMMCADMTVESAIVEALSTVASFAPAEDDSTKMLFYNVQGEVILTTVKGVSEENDGPQGIEGAWNIMSVYGIPTTTAETSTAMTFSTETNTFHGNAGCNGIGGEFVMSDDSLSFSNVLVNSAMCSDETMSIESKILEALNNTKMWTIENKELHLKNANGESLAILKREE